jgi:hypothetical protein
MLLLSRAVQQQRTMTQSTSTSRQYQFSIVASTFIDSDMRVVSDPSEKDEEQTASSS